jgi:DNA modification methylase
MSVRILIGDCREKLRELQDASVNCCVTSPPYFGLRDYGTASWEGGGPDCDHLNGALASDKSTLAGYTSENIKLRTNGMPFRDLCGKCGAARIDRQMGLETTPDEFVAGMVEVFREVRRVLRDDGTLWLNIGDSYSGSGKGGNPEAGKQATNKGSQSVGVLYGKTGETARQAAVTNVTRDVHGIAPKNLIGIPWMLAFALRADGWYLRQDIIWSKPNPMPESVRDRCTKAHEYLFLLSKSQRYYFDADAIAEPAIYSGITGMDASGFKNPMNFSGKHAANPDIRGERPRGHERSHEGFAKWDLMSKAEQCSGTRNKRSVWEVATQPFSEAHFATYPPALIEPCILAGCPVGGTVLDPFGGAGTTGLVADRLQRDAILIELNPEYAEIARNRIASEAGMFGEVLAA